MCPVFEEVSIKFWIHYFLLASENIGGKIIMDFLFVLENPVTSFISKDFSHIYF